MVITGCFILYNYFNAVMSGSNYFSFVLFQMTLIKNSHTDYETVIFNIMCQLFNQQIHSPNC